MSNKFKYFLFVSSFILALVAFVTKMLGTSYYADRIDYVILILVLSPCIIYFIYSLKSIESKGLTFYLDQDVKRKANDLSRDESDEIEKAKKEYQNIDYDTKAQFIILFGQVEYKLRQLFGSHPFRSLHHLIRENREQIGDEVVRELSDIVPLRNKLVHGEPVDIKPESIKYYYIILYSILSKLDKKLEEKK